MADSTTLAEHRDVDTGRHDGRAAGQDEPAAAASDRAGRTAASGPLVADELLVEEVSIDGMCGVY